MTKTYIFFDTETTGLPKPDAAPLRDQPQIIEFAGIKTDSEFNEIGRMEFLCHPGCSLPEEIIKITGITDADLEGKLPFAAHFNDLTDFFLGARAMVAHNLAFDKSLLKFELTRLGKELAFPWPPDQICTVEASYTIRNRRLRLHELHTMACGEPHKDAHRAMADVEALVRVAKWLRQEGHL